MTGQQLKNSILQMAVQGKLVPQDPNDEPASVLLERIRKEKEQLIKEGKIKKEKNPSYIFRGADNLPYEKVGKNEPVCIADEVPFEIPESWEWVRLGNIFQHNTGYAKDAQPEVLVTLIQTIVERIYIVDKDDERFCHIFIKGCSGEDYTGFFQTAGYIEQKTTHVCDSEQYCIDYKLSAEL